MFGHGARQRRGHCRACARARRPVAIDPPAGIL